MKFTSIVTTATLVAFTDFDGAAAAISRTRGVERTGTEEGHLHRALSPDKKAGGKGGSCPSECKDGAVYYKYKNFDMTTSFQVALEETPFNCVLAPVESFSDLLEILSVIPTNTFGTYKANTWVGIGKSAADVAVDSTVAERREGWLNLDGSEVPVDSNLWIATEPNNAENYQTRAYVDGGGNTKRLGDLNPQGFRNGGLAQVHAAVYKCCYDLCPEPPTWQP